MNAIQYYLVTEGSLIAAGVLNGGTIDGVEIIEGGIVIGTPGFYGKVNDSVFDAGDLGILVPIYIDVLSSVYQIDPSYCPVRRNTSGIVLQTAAWTKMTADISAGDKQDIASRTLASMNAEPPDVNVKRINGYQIAGAGTEANPWGPS
jgi:hypothetical protein